MEHVAEYDVPALHTFNDSLATYLAGLALLHKAKSHVIAQTDWCQARTPKPGARLSYTAVSRIPYSCIVYIQL